MTAARSLTLDEITVARRELDQRIVTTPVHEWQSPALTERIGPGARVFLKLELFQCNGSFKARAALLNMQGSRPRQLNAALRRSAPATTRLPLPMPPRRWGFTRSS